MGFEGAAACGCGLAGLAQRNPATAESGLQQLGHIHIHVAQADLGIQAQQGQHVARRGQALVLPAAISGTLIQVGLQAVLAQQQVFAQARQQAVGQQLFARENGVRSRFQTSFVIWARTCPRSSVRGEAKLGSDPSFTRPRIRRRAGRMRPSVIVHRLGQPHRSP